MKRQIWIPLALGIVATYIFLDRRAARYATEYDEIESAADRTDLWGSKQRIAGTGRDLLGKVKEGVGRIAGDDDLGRSRRSRSDCGRGAGYGRQSGECRQRHDSRIQSLLTTSSDRRFVSLQNCDAQPANAPARAAICEAVQLRKSYCRQSPLFHGCVDGALPLLAGRVDGDNGEAMAAGGQADGSGE